jgi:hypothetical protein
MQPDFSKFKECGYAKFVENDAHNSDDIAHIKASLGQPIPTEYVQFLNNFPDTGIFEQQVECLGLSAAPCAPDRIYPITLLYAACSDKRYDILQVRANQYEIPLSYLLFGEDAGGNLFFISLDEKSFGKVYFLYAEESIDLGSYLLADNFSSFIRSLRLTRE